MDAHPDASERLLDTRALAAFLGISAATVRRRVRDQQLPQPKWLGTRSPRWLASEIGAWLRERANPMTREPLAGAVAPWMIRRALELLDAAEGDVARAREAVSEAASIRAERVEDDPAC